MVGDEAPGAIAVVREAVHGLLSRRSCGIARRSSHAIGASLPLDGLRRAKGDGRGMPAAALRTSAISLYMSAASLAREEGVQRRVAAALAAKVGTTIVIAGLVQWLVCEPIPNAMQARSAAVASTTTGTTLVTVIGGLHHDGARGRRCRRLACLQAGGGNHNAQADQAPKPCHGAPPSQAGSASKSDQNLSNAATKNVADIQDYQSAFVQLQAS